MNNSNIITSKDLQKDLSVLLKPYAPDQIFLIVDKHIAELHLAEMLSYDILSQCHYLVLPDGDEFKNFETLSKVWTFFSENGTRRSSVVLNIGGGMVTDLGGFAAATFKRGVDFINIPTTILAAVDASIGGKTGINFNGLKNEIGVFAKPKAIVVYFNFFKSLDSANMISGFAEMLKHALISDAILVDQILSFSFEHIDFNRMTYLVEQNLSIKIKFVDDDPMEKNIRKSLNFGHTFGHAYEELSFQKDCPMLHGYAVMWGMISELYLSVVKFNFPKEVLQKVFQFAKENYGVFPFTCDDYETLFELMKHDKKNDSSEINFTLLANIGDIRLNQHIDKKLIFEAIDFIREN